MERMVNGMKKWLSALIGGLVFAAIGLSAAMAQPYVFSQAPTYEYRTDEVSIGVLRVQENDVTYFLADVSIHSPEHLETALSGKYEGIKTYGA